MAGVRNAEGRSRLQNPVTGPQGPRREPATMTPFARLRPWRRLAAVAAAACTLAGAAVAATAQPTRPASDGVERWNLGDLYHDDTVWTRAYEREQARAETLAALRERLGQGAQGLFEVLDTISVARQQATRLGVYAALKADEDLRDARAQERRQMATQLEARIGEQTAWLAPAVQALGPGKVQAALAEHAGLRARFDFALAEMLRLAPHTLSPEGEVLLAGVQPLLQQPYRVFEQLGTAELAWPRVKLHGGGPTVTLDMAAFEKHRSHPDRRRRQQVFDAYFGTWKRVEGSVGATLTTQVLGDVFAARARKHPSSLAAALVGDAMPEAVYRTLVAQAREGLPVLHRYLKLRQRMLGIRGPLGYHDNYPPLVPVPRGLRFDLASAKRITVQVLQPMGDEYGALLRQGLAAPWTDSHPRPGKTSGAYMMGAVHGLHPYVLLNHNDDYESLSTLAHEWGHAVHTLLAQAAQPAEKSDYSTFIAESASIANEMLLQDHLISTARTREEKLFYLSQALEAIRTTFFRQTLFAEFQLAMHEEVEQGRPLSGARLSELYCDVARRYYGQAQGVMSIAPAYCVEWAYISHFYYGYYVWQYATSMAGAAEFARAIGSDGPPARERFLQLLRAGGSDQPYRLYVRAGVDLAQPEPYRALMQRMQRLLHAFEQTLGAGRR